MRVLEINMGDGEIYQIHASIIALERAKYYIGRDLEKGNITEDEYDNALNAEIMNADDYDIIDWAGNNMDWEDVKDIVTKITPPPKDDSFYRNGWSNGDKRVIDVDE